MQPLRVILACFAAAFVASSATAQTTAPPRATTDEALGVYSGPFGPNTITIRLEKIDGKTASGYSEVGNNRRPFNGAVTMRGGTPHFEVREPGDNPEDGVFQFQYSPEPQALAGTWTPNNKKLAAVKFTLAKSGPGRRDTPAPPSGDGREGSANSGFTDGTISRYEQPLGASLIIRDAKGVEHTFAASRGDMSVMSYLHSESLIGKRIRIHWETGVDPQTGAKVRFALATSDFGGGLYFPPKESAERKAIMEAVRAQYERRYKRRASFEGSVRVENGWAGFSGTAKEPNDKGPGAIWVAILRGSDTKWKVIATSEGDENAAKPGAEGDRPHWDELKRLNREYPNAPTSIVGLLDYP